MLKKQAAGSARASASSGDVKPERFTGRIYDYILGLEVSGLYLGSPLQNLLTNPQPRIHEEAGLEKSRVLGSDREENNSATSFCFIVFLIFHSLIDGGSLSVADRKSVV